MAEIKVDLSFRAGLPRFDLPPKLDFPQLPTPCGMPMPTSPSLPLPKVPSLDELLELAFGITIPIPELPTICPELLEAALIAAVLAYNAAES